MNFTAGPGEKPSFFETSVEVPPYLRPGAMNKADKGRLDGKNILSTLVHNLDSNVQDIDEHLEEYQSESESQKPKNSGPSYMKITGKGSYYNYKDFMRDYFDHRELVAMKPFDRIERIKQTREFYKSKNYL